MGNFDDMKQIDISDISDIDLDNLPDGATYIFEDGTPVAVLMSIEYYKYLEHLMDVLKDKILGVQKKNE